MHTDAHAQIIEILDIAHDMTIATIRPDGFPQATVVAFAHDDRRLYFFIDQRTQKARNTAGCDKVSATITRPNNRWEEIEGLSLGGFACEVNDPDELRAAQTLFAERYAEAVDFGSDYLSEVALFRGDPVVISLIDYTKGFGHTELLEVEEKLPR